MSFAFTLSGYGELDDLADKLAAQKTKLSPEGDYTVHYVCSSGEWGGHVGQVKVKRIYATSVNGALVHAPRAPEGWHIIAVIKEKP